MQKYLVFFLVIGASGFVYFSYINMVGKSMKGQAKPAPTQTEQILQKQTENIKRLNQDYQSIIEQSKQSAQDAAKGPDYQAIRNNYDQTMSDNRRQIEENRRQMEQMRQELQRQ